MRDAAACHMLGRSSGVQRPSGTPRTYPDEIRSPGQVNRSAAAARCSRRVWPPGHRAREASLDARGGRTFQAVECPPRSQLAGCHTLQPGFSRCQRERGQILRTSAQGPICEGCKRTAASGGEAGLAGRASDLINVGQWSLLGAQSRVPGRLARPDANSTMAPHSSPPIQLGLAPAQSTRR